MLKLEGMEIEVLRKFIALFNNVLALWATPAIDTICP